MKPQGFFARLMSLWRGFWSSNLRNAEVHNPQYVYESALQERRVNFQKLKANTSQLILLRNRAQAKMQVNQETLQLLEASIKKAAIADNDARAVALIRKKQLVMEQNERLENDIFRLNEQLGQAKEAVEESRRGFEALEHERDELVARKNYAVNRLELQELFDASEESLRASDSALEYVRDSVTHLEIQAELSNAPELCAVPTISAAQLREEATLAKAEQELQQRKLILSERLLRPTKTPLTGEDISNAPRRAGVHS